MRVRLTLVAALAACQSSPSPIDNLAAASAPASAAADPWSKAMSGDPSSADDGDKKPGALGGFDLQGMLGKVKDAIDKPGPYETPGQSRDFDPAKKHVGVMKLGGAIVEREAFSLTGSHGTELRAVIDRFRELAKDDLLTGLVVRVDGLQISLPDAIELRAALHDFRATKKTLTCHAEGADNATYLVL